jgi:hypothetical protein
MKRCYWFLDETSRSFAAVIKALDPALRYVLANEASLNSRALKSLCLPQARFAFDLVYCTYVTRVDLRLGARGDLSPIE